MRYRYWKFVSKLNARHMLLAWVSLVWVSLADLYIWLSRTGPSPTTTGFPDERVERPHRADTRDGSRGPSTTTSSWSAPAAPVCAPRSRLTQRGAAPRIVCKSLLGKAHTVMAEGGMAAAMGNVWPEDNWQVHFRDTMRGGKMLNIWRMAQLHAQEAPDRVKELEEWGAVFDRTTDGRILQRDFGGHRYAAPRARRRPHRPRDDPHAAEPRRVARASTSSWSAPCCGC